MAVEVLYANDMTNSRLNHGLLEGPSTSAAALALRRNSAAVHMPSISEINYFAKVLCAKLCDCFNVLCSNLSQPAGPHQYAVIVRFVSVLHEVCCQSPHKDALQSVFRQVLAESNFLDQYYNFLLICSRNPVETVGNLLVDEATRELQQFIQIEIFKLLSSMNLLDGLVLLQQIQTVGIKWNVQRTLLHEVCLRKRSAMDWNLQQVRQLFGLNVRVLEFLITEQFTFLLNLCAADDEFCSLLQIALLEHTSTLKQVTIRPLLHLIWHLCNPTQNGSTSIQCVVKFLQLVGELHRLNATDKMLQLPLERLLSKIISTMSEHNKNVIYECLQHNSNSNNSHSANYILTLCQKYLFNGANRSELLENTTKTTGISNKMGNFTQLDSRIIDEKWLYAQLIKFSSQENYDAHQLAKILLEIQSENKLHKMFNTTNFDVHDRVLRHAINGSLHAMLAAFRNNCIQHNPHIHYLQPNPLARVACTVLMTRIEASLGRETLPLMGEVVVSTKASDAAGDSIDVNASVAFACGFKVVSNIDAINKGTTDNGNDDDNVDVHVDNDKNGENALVAVCANLSEAVSALLKCLKDIESTALIYIEARLIKRFVCENFLRAPELRLLLRFIDYCCQRAHWVLTHCSRHCHYGNICSILRVLDLLLQQELIWKTLNQGDNILPHEKGQLILRRVLDLIVLCLKQTLQNTNFYRQFKLMLPTFINDTFLTGNDSQEKSYASKAIFIAKLIEALRENFQIQFPNDFKGLEMETPTLPLNLIISIGISVLRTHQFYAYAVTPFEIMQQQLREERVMAASRAGSKQSSPAKGKEIPSGKMPTIPLENLSDVDVLRNFVKRLSIFGFTTRQQFEEYFMTFLLLINKVYDENMVDQQEQFQIKSTCFEAILELLITYKTFPIVGNKLSQFHHTTRWPRINCENISLKKLHKVQLLISPSNVFYHGNLERQLTCDTVIGTKSFYYNQYDLNFIWQQMEAYAAQPSPTSTSSDSDNTSDMLSGGAGDNNEWHFANKSISDVGSTTKAAGIEDITVRNYRYFTTLSGVDFKSSSQLIFDVLMQMIEHNHIMALPNLVKFCEICESRDQIKWIKDKAIKLQEHIPMDDTISHQHLIYLVCKTQAMLIPTLSELQQLCSLIGTYLKSSHVFIRNATLSGVLSLLECCYKTNTTIGKLSDELALLRDLIVGYINRHGIIDESSMNCSDTHLKLVWTLNFCLIEWTSKFVPQCHLLSNAIISASNFLRKTSNEDVYLCVLHGLERIIVIDSASSSSGSSSAHLVTKGNIVTPALRHKIEKLAVDLVKVENERFSIPALKLLLSCMYMGSASQLEITELSNGIVQDDPEIIAQQTDKVDILLHCIKSSTRDAAWIYGQVLCQIIRDLVPPNEILTKVIKEFLTINQPHRDVIAMIVYQVFRSAIDSSFLPMLQDWLICSLPTFLSLPVQKGVWSLSVIFISASINLHLIKLFPVVLSSSGGGNLRNSNNNKSTKIDDEVGEIEAYGKLGRHDIALFVTAAEDFHAKLSTEQKIRFRDAFKKFEKHPVYAKMLQNL